MKVEKLVPSQAGKDQTQACPEFWMQFRFSEELNRNRFAQEAGGWAENKTKDAA